MGNDGGKKIITAVEPTYWPSLSLLDRLRILSKDCKDDNLTVILDEVYFDRKRWHNSTIIRTDKGYSSLTVPMQRSGRGKKIKDAKVQNARNWQDQHLNEILKHYQDAPFLAQHTDFLRELYQKREFKSLFDLDIFILRYVANQFGLNLKLKRQSQLSYSHITADDALAGLLLLQGDALIKVSGRNREEKLKSIAKTMDLIEMCKSVEATTYVAAQYSQSFIVPELFRYQGIDLVKQRYTFMPYPQGSETMPSVTKLSSLDLLLWQGRTGRYIASAPWQVREIKAYKIKSGNTNLAIVHYLVDAQNPTIIVGHGFKQDKNKEFIEFIIGKLIGACYNVVAFDFFGHGESGGQFRHLTTSKMIKNIDAVIVEAKRLSANDRIAFLGHSYAPFVALLYAQQTPNFRYPIVAVSPTLYPKAEFLKITSNSTNVRKWQESGWISVDKTGRLFDTDTNFILDYKFYDDLNGHRLDKDVISHIKSPVLAILGENDEWVKSNDLNRFFPVKRRKRTAVENAKEHVIIPHATHYYRWEHKNSRTTEQPRNVLMNEVLLWLANKLDYN